MELEGGGGGGGLNRGFTVILSTASIILFLELLPGNEWASGEGDVVLNPNCELTPCND